MSNATTDESMPIYLGLAVLAIILIAFFSKGGSSNEEKAPPAVSTSTATTTTSKKSKKKSATNNKVTTPPPPPEKKVEETTTTVEIEQEEVAEVVKTTKKKKKNKKKKKSAEGGDATAKTNGSADATPAPAPPAAAAQPKKVVAFDDDDEDSDDDVDLWVIQSSAKRKGANDAAKRAAANKERERAKKQQAAAEKQRKEKEQAEAAAAADKAAVAAAEAEAAQKEAAAASSKASKENQAVNGEFTPVVGATGEKKKRKRNKKKKAAAAVEEKAPVAPVTPAPQWETVPVVEEWQEVGSKKSNKSKANDSAAVAALIDEPVVEEAGEISVTVDVGSDQQQIIIGKGGATIQMLQTTTGAKFNLNRTTNVLTITGSEDSVQLGLAQARSILATEAERKANEVTEKLTWTSDAIKGVIGRGGANIRATEEATGCKIDADVESGTLAITGSADQVSIALTMCHNAAFGEVQKVLELGSRNAVNVVYGPNFQTIRGMQDSTGCRLDIDRGTTTLKLAGSADAVAAATAQIHALLEANRGFEMTIDNSKVGSVYGKGGETLRSIQDRTGTQIDVARGPTHATVSVMGSAEASQRARNMLQRAIDGEVELKPGEVAEELELGSATAAVIGRGGSNVAELEKTHGVKINVRSELQKARITGKPEKVAAASKAIQAIAKPILDAEAARKKADEQLASGESAWQVEDGADDTDGW